MKIAVIGAGNVGSALGKGWLSASHEVVFGVRDPHSAKTIKTLSLVQRAPIKAISEAAAWAEVIVITTPPEAVIELIPQLGDLSGKVVIDATNAVRTRPEPFATAYHAIKATAKHIDIAKCFNSTGYENMLNPIYHGEGIDMFVAGDSLKAKQIATQLAKDIGFCKML